MRGWLALALALALGGCFRPSPPEGLGCGPDRWCPAPLTCGIDDRCRSTGGPIDAPGSDGDADAPRIDADPSRSNLAFVAATPVAPKMLGGPTSADAMCDTIAHAAGHLGKFIAWISTPANSASTRLGASRGWVRVDGRPFADTRADLLGGRIYYPLRLDETGAQRAVVVQTGTTADGVGSEDCVDYTSGSDQDLILVGSSDATIGRWTNDSEGNCNVAYAYYCLQVDHDFALPPPAESGPKAFLSNVNFTAQSGLAAADTLCQTEAAARGLGGTFLALLSTTGASALSRFGGLPAQPWVRLDGAAATRDFATWDAPIAFTASNEYSDQGVWSGSISAAQPAASTSDSCNNWSPGGTSARVGQSSRAGPEGFGGGSGACGSPRRIYCLEKQ